MYAIPFSLLSFVFFAFLPHDLDPAIPFLILWISFAFSHWFMYFPIQCLCVDSCSRSIQLPLSPLLHLVSHCPGRLLTNSLQISSLQHARLSAGSRTMSSSVLPSTAKMPLAMRLAPHPGIQLFSDQSAALAP